MIYIQESNKAYFATEQGFDDYFAIEGEVRRRFKNRRTIRFERAGRGFFIKCHQGVGWREIIKNLVQLRRPVLGAHQEWQAIQRLQALGVATMNAVGYGVQGWNPARQYSFLITEDLGPNVSLEDLTRDWRARPPDPRLKRALISRLAAIARRLHENGVNHRDFYICHFLLDTSLGLQSYHPDHLRINVIDLHRAQLRKRTPKRWIVKDIGSLYFSAMDIGLTQRDLWRFMTVYRDRPLRTILRDEARFWRKVQRRAIRLYRATWNTAPPL